MTRGRAEHFMMQLIVDDLDPGWAHIEPLDLPRPLPRAAAEAAGPAAVGLREAYVTDPSWVPSHLVHYLLGAAHD